MHILKVENAEGSQAYSNSCNRVCYFLNSLQACPRKAKFCMTRIRFYNRKPVRGERRLNKGIIILKLKIFQGRTTKA